MSLFLCPRWRNKTDLFIINSLLSAICFVRCRCAIAVGLASLCRSAQVPEGCYTMSSICNILQNSLWLPAPINYRQFELTYDPSYFHSSDLSYCGFLSTYDISFPILCCKTSCNFASLRPRLPAAAVTSHYTGQVQTGNMWFCSPIVMSL